MRLQLSGRQTKAAAVVFAILWLVGLVASILAKRQREKSGTGRASQPLILFLSLTGALCLISGLVYYERGRLAAQSRAAAPDPSAGGARGSGGGEEIPSSEDSLA